MESVPSLGCSTSATAEGAGRAQFKEGSDGTGHGQPQVCIHSYREEGAGLTLCLPAVLQLDRSLCLELAGFVCELVRVELDLEPDLSANEVAIGVERPVGPRRFELNLKRAQRRTRRGHPGNSEGMDGAGWGASRMR